VSVSLPSLDGPGDAELISAVRGGDVDAYGELFARHVDAARRLARQLAGAADAEDLVSDAFTKVLTVLQRGGGPDLAFRAYLLTAVRRLHVDRIRSGSRLRPVEDLTPFDPGLPFRDTAVEGFDNAAAARAFASLPERWQMVLWHTEVEQQKPADIAPLLGMSANSVSALAYRAREGLRQAFLSQHAADPDDVDCAWTRDHLGAYIRGGLSRRDTTRVQEHIEACRACAAVYLELTEVNTGLAAIIAPLVLGAAGVEYFSGSAGGGTGAVSSGFAAAKTWVAANATLSAVGGVAVTATVLAAIYGASHLGSHGAPAADTAPALDRPPATASNTPGTNGHQSGHHSPAGTTGNNSGPHQNGVVPPQLPVDSTTAPSSTGPTDQPSSAPPSTGPTGNGPSNNPSSNPPSSTPPSTEPTSAPPSSVPTAQTISFTSTPPSNPALGSKYHVTANGGSGHITFSIDSSTTHQACILTHPHTVLFQHAGTCVIAADTGSGQNADAAAASTSNAGSATQTVVVPQVSQAVTFSSTPGDVVVGGAAYQPTATGGKSGNAVVFSSGTPGVCTVSGDGVTFQHAQACTVVATQAGNSDYKPATVSQTFTVGKGTQVVDFSVPDNAVAGGPTYALDQNASGGPSGNPVTFAIDAAGTTNDSCALADDGVTLSFHHQGTCAVTANQQGNDDYADAAPVTQSFDVAQAPATALMNVTATAVPLHGKGQEEATAVVTGLPDGYAATLTVRVDGDAHIITQSPACSEQDEGNGGQTFVCDVTTPGEQDFVFDATVNKNRPVMTFDLAATPPLVLDPASQTHFELPLGDAADAIFGQRSFALGEQR
jgi:RNA polymerase sigma factor (sigma-70 family)